MKRALTTLIGFTLLLGLAYPLALAGVARLFPERTDLIALDTKGDPRYFQPRPSQTDYAPDATAFSNRGPNQSSAYFFYRDQIAAYRELNGADPPMDAVTTSGSGVDPHISRANAELQARRIARVRRIPLERVRALIDGDLLNTTVANRELDR